jgi:fibronectin type 3 domain-containing protein
MKKNSTETVGTPSSLFQITPPCHQSRRLIRETTGAILLLLFVLCFQASPIQAQTASAAPIVGEIERLTLNNPNDVWSGGIIVVGGQNIIIPRNLLLDLPANRLTLQQTFAQAPSACLTRAESGLAKADICNTGKVGGIATIAANRTSNGNVIAGDVFIQKGIEKVKGVVSYINYTDGYFRVNGITNDPNTGVMIRLNDPLSRHTVQQGLGCVAGSLNCSPDKRFTLDRDNYTNTFSTGVPSCLPSVVSRSFVDAIDVDGDGNTTETLTALSSATGTGDLLCPSTNRTANLIVADSRRFAPIQIGDSLEAEGNFETVNGVKFVSAHTTTISRALGTRNVAGQPDYLIPDEVGIDAPGFQNQRVRTLFIGFASLNTDVMIWSLHYDPSQNAAHEFPLATTVGCDNAAGAVTCGANGLVAGVGGNIWKIRHDVDFVDPATQPRLNPCAHLRADPRLAASNPCPGGGTFEEQFGILSPVPHEIMTRTGRKFADAAGTLKTIDIRGAAATNGEYLFPLGIGLGGIVGPEFVEIDLNALDTPFSFSGIPWNLDRRLSPGGCIGGCEPTLQPLSPFPFEIIDPRTQAGVPTGQYNDPNFTASVLSNASNRILSYVNFTLNNFDGNNTILPWPPANPPAQPITPTNVFTPPTTCDTTSPTAPAGLTATAASPTTINLSWTASTDDIGVTGYKVFRDNAASPMATVIGTTFSDTGLAPSTTHTYSVMASDATGNLSPASNVATATTPADTVAPTAPANLTASAANSTTVNLSWTASSDNVGVVSYSVFRDGGGTSIAIVSGTSFSDVGLAVGSTHSYLVKASDLANNQSAASGTVVVTTPGADVTPPSVPAGLTATGASASVIDIAWTASTDNTGVAGYKVFCDGGTTEIATVSTGTSFSDTGLAVGSTHSYQVSAFDTANNQSAKSTSASATTQITGALVSLALNPTTVTAPGLSTGTVTLSGAAPAGGLSVTLSSGDTRKATVPATVTVPAGATTANFTVTSRTGQLGGGQNPVTITATLAGTGRTATLIILRP